MDARLVHVHADLVQHSENSKVLCHLLSSTLRQCNEECVLRGVHFDKGVSIFVPISFVHHDPQLWVDPQVFNPERLAS